MTKTNAGYIFEQLINLSERLEDDQFSRQVDLFSGASVGKHFRHIIEFFQCISLAAATDTICYDNRLRDERIETSRSLACELLKGLQSELAEIDGDRNLTLIGDLSVTGGSGNSYMTTSLSREFHYAVEHAIHHMAIIKMGIRQAFPLVSIPDDFGVAPSTLRYQRAVSE